MIKNIIQTLACSAAILSMTACDNTMAKKYGGTMTVELEGSEAS